MNSDSEIDMVEVVDPPPLIQPAHNEEMVDAKTQRISTESFRVASFADRTTLAWWFPQILDDETRSWRIWFSRRSRAMLVQIILIGLIFFANLGLTIFAIVRYGSQKGVGLIFEGECYKVRSLDQWIHLLINLLSTGLLSASNYCMQLQVAPTRANVDRAHRKGERLDIGIPSLRNLRYVSTWKRVSWVLLALTSVPIHLIYNSAVFQSLSSTNYTIAVVKDSFLNGSTWTLEAAESRRLGMAGWDTLEEGRLNPTSFNNTQIIQDMQREAMAGFYTRRNVSSCFDLYDDYWRPQGNALIFVRNLTVQSPTDDSLLLYVSVIPRSDDWAKNMWALGNGTSDWFAISPTPLVKPITAWYLGPPAYEVSHCLVQPPEQIPSRCRFEYSPYIMSIVCFMNLVKVIIMIIIWAQRRSQNALPRPPEEETLYTLGDAIASFMRVPDLTTVDMGLVTKYELMTTRRWRITKGWRVQRVTTLANPSREPREYRFEARRWHSAISPRRWTIAIVFCVAIVVYPCISFAHGMKSFRARKMSHSLPSLWKLGFGALTPYTYLVTALPRKDPEGLISNVLLANTPQVIVSFVYMVVNIVLSAYLVQREFSGMHKTRKPLRVSEPLGIQRSSYFISLPMRYGIPFYVTSGFMHWMISQSLFLARITAFYPNGEVDVEHSFSTCGYSPIAVVITLFMEAALFGVVVWLGFRKYDGVMRMVSTNSRAISAACHVPPEDQETGYLLPVQWGVVSMSGGVGKCAFTTAPEHEMRMPQEGVMYK
ncbi:hypothetical protein OQA88_7953 [Cercophora sp. LCS_1]